MEVEEKHFRVKFIKRRWLKKIIFIFVLFFFIFPMVAFFSFFFLVQPPENFPTNQVFEIKKGQSVNEIANFLEKQEIINSALLFKLFNYYQKNFININTNIKSSHYSFHTPLDTLKVFFKLEKGESGIDDIGVVIPEGWANFQIAKKMSETFKKISEDKFLKLAKEYEGYLYPSKYYFSEYEVSEEIIIEKMLDTFKKKNKEIKAEVDKSDSSWEKIIIMASIIEKEANSNYEIKRKVSGVLWKRISINMPLQVDVFVDYILKEHTPRKTFEHLKIDSPYNTYLHKGLTPTPMSNPSRDSIKAAFWPEETEYLYYLTGKDGNFYFSKTYKQHLIYKDKYISNYISPKKIENVVK